MLSAIVKNSSPPRAVMAEQIRCILSEQGGVRLSRDDSSLGYEAVMTYPDTRLNALVFLQRKGLRREPVSDMFSSDSLAPW